MLRVLIAFALGLALAGCGSAEESAPAREPPAGSLTDTTLDGETLSVADFRGTPVFVNGWSSKAAEPKTTGKIWPPESRPVDGWKDHSRG